MNKARRNKSITAYPLFAAFVALWFAALFGLSSVAVGMANLERAVAATQLHLLIPAAAPPLGMTARALIAAAMAVLGGGIGFAIGLLLARQGRPATPIAVRARDTHPDAPIRRPISAHEEFGDVEDEDPEAVREMQALRAARDEPDFELPAFIADDLPEVSEAKPETPAPAAFGLPVGEAAERIASADLAGLSPVELLERLAIAMQQRLDRRAAEAGQDAPSLEAPDGSVTVFPGPAPELSEPASDETEKALRDALAALQRMTGTA